MVNTIRVVVIGGGLFGAAAARHLAEDGHRVAVVTSPERPDAGDRPGSTTGGDGRGVGLVASHYDQGRIVRWGGSDPMHAALAQASVRRYPELARRSGIDFLQPRPVVIITPDPDADVRHSRAVGADVEVVSLADVKARTGIVAPPGSAKGAVVESATAGIVNPRLLVQAQLALAARAGATVIPRPAVGLDLGLEGGGGSVRVAVEDGRRIEADRLVLATGPHGTELTQGALGVARPIQRRLRTIALVEVDGPTDELPSLSASGFLHPSSTDPRLEETYWVPPVRYPDGGRYLKIGGNSLPMITAAADGDLDRWFRSGGSTDEAAALFALARDLLPGRGLRLAAHKPCVVSYTQNEEPIIERASDEVVLVLAGNGSGATIGDEVGRRAAELVAG